MKQPSVLRQIGDRSQIRGYWVYKMDAPWVWAEQQRFYMHDDMTFNISHFDGHVERVQGVEDTNAPTRDDMDFRFWGNSEFNRAWDPWYENSKGVGSF